MSAPIAPEFRGPVMPWRLLEDYRPLGGVYDENDWSRPTGAADEPSS